MFSGCVHYHGTGNYPTEAQRVDIFPIETESQLAYRLTVVMQSSAPDLTLIAPGASAPGSEGSFWRRLGAGWRQLAGGFIAEGFSFEWHELDGTGPLVWAPSFHQRSVEVCLNLEGCGWVAAGDLRMDFTPKTAGFFATNGRPLRAERSGGGRHRFLSAEFSLRFLDRHLTEHRAHLQPGLGNWLASQGDCAALSTVSPLSQRHRDLMKSLLQPPVLASAQRLWFHSKALEFAAEFLFYAETEPLCNRARRVAAERVGRAKAVLRERLADPPELAELGRLIGCSPFYLSRTFTAETGQTISQWVRQARMEKAAELLRSGRFNVTQTALEVGYSSLSYFSHAFHETFGCCPGLYPLRTTSQPQRPQKPF